MLSPASFGVSAANYPEFLATLRRSHEIRIIVQALNKDTHEPIQTLSHLLLSGQVDCEAVLGDKDDVANSRTCSLKFLDPKRSMVFTADSPLDGALYFDKFIRVYYSVRTNIANGNGGWVDVPVFTGPITNLLREGDTVTVEAAGKEVYGLSNAFHAVSIPKNTEKVDALRTLLERMGETSGNMGDIPSTSERLPKSLDVKAEEKLWPAAFKLVKSLVLGNDNQRLFYNARGQVQVKAITGASVMTMATGDNGFILSDPTINYSLTDLKNVVKVVGRKFSGSATVVVRLAQAAITDVLGPLRLGRNGRGRYYLYVIDNPKVIGAVEAYQLAVSQRNYWMNQQVETTFECLPVPHLEPWDYITVTTEKYSNQFVPVRRFTLPLTADSPMTIGATKPVADPRRVA